MNSKIHRESGPAFESANGDKQWWLNNKLYKLEQYDGNITWYKNDVIHRIDGPAVEYPDGTKEWWLKGKNYSEEEFNQKRKESSYE